MNRDEIIGGVVIFLFGAVTTVLSLSMPIGTFRKSGTGMFPFILGIILMLLSGLFLLQHFLKKKHVMGEKESTTKKLVSSKQIILFFGTMVLATLFLNRLGYPITSFLLMLVLLKILGMKRWSFNILLSSGTAVVCYFLFVQWLKIPLPKGLIGL